MQSARVFAGGDQAAAGFDQENAALVRVADIPLGGNTTRLDYESLDQGRHLLFIAHLGDSAVIVFDTRADRVVTRIEGISKVHGVLAIPELGTVYASATGADEVVAIDEQTFKVTAHVAGGVYPDGMAYAPDVHKLYVSDEHGATETVIDVRTNTRIASIPLGGEVGNSQYDPLTKHVFVNVQTRRQLVEITSAGIALMDDDRAERDAWLNDTMRDNLSDLEFNLLMLVAPILRKLAYAEGKVGILRP